MLSGFSLPSTQLGAFAMHPQLYLSHRATRQVNLNRTLFHLKHQTATVTTNETPSSAAGSARNAGSRYNLRRQTSEQPFINGKPSLILAGSLPPTTCSPSSEYRAGRPSGAFGAAGSHLSEHHRGPSRRGRLQPLRKVQLAQREMRPGETGIDIAQPLAHMVGNLMS